MPNPALSAALQEAFALAPSSRVVLDTIEVRQTGVQPPVYLVRAAREIQARLETGETPTFQPVGFRLTLPAESTEGVRVLTVSFDNVGRELLEFIRTAKESPVPVEMVYRPYLSDDLFTPQLNPPLRMYLRDIQITPTTLTGRATFMDLMNLRFPNELYTRDRFPFLQ